MRRQYWSLVADLVTERYFGALGAWCQEHGVASSGHTLVEESILLQSAVEGNGLQVLSRMQIPGLDALSSDPEAVIHIGWLTAGLPASAAALTGQRRVMTEVSDFVQKMGNAGPASLAEMQATAAWQATWGVTEFTLYYSQADRPIEQYRAIATLSDGSTPCSSRLSVSPRSCSTIRCTICGRSTGPWRNNWACQASRHDCSRSSLPSRSSARHSNATRFPSC